MKFAKELEEDLVPEWRVKYFNYKQGKKKIKAVQRAIRNARSPRTPLRPRPTPRQTWNVNELFSNSASAWNKAIDGDQSAEPNGNAPSGGTEAATGKANARPGDGKSARPIPVPQPVAALDEEDGRDPTNGELTRAEGGHWTRYGSIIGSPPSPKLSRPATLNLPDPAMDPESDESLLGSDAKTSPTHSKRIRFPHLAHSFSGSLPSSQGQPSAFEVGQTRHPSLRPFLSRSLKSATMDTPAERRRRGNRPLIERLFTSKNTTSVPKGFSPDVPLEVLQELDQKQAEFWTFLADELKKIEKFYKEKEDESTKRLETLREQLHILRDQRLEESYAYEHAKLRRRMSKHRAGKAEDEDEDEVGPLPDLRHESIRSAGMDIIQHPIKTAKKVTFHPPPGKPNYLVTPPNGPQEGHRDYERRPESPDVPYVAAKRKLKAALQEFYRGLELLKSYALLNRTAFRKINKKYDKTVQARPTMRFMNEKVNEAYFVKSTVIDGHITAVEDLYARYFEKGNHKVAVGKLRQKVHKYGDYTGSAFRNGVLLAAGLVFAIQALVDATLLLSSSNFVLADRTSYLLQLYAGYFLLVFLTLFFCVDCRIFNDAKVNYVFVFEFDTRHTIDWRQLIEMPSLFFFLLGLIMWLNFHIFPQHASFLFYPVMLIGITLVILFFPVPYFYYESRKWFLYSCWRLLLAGLYPVEFRDFFLGDMLCSLTYTLGHVEMFFCLYGTDWNNPAQCNSSHSRLLGFCSTLPGIWRLLQCLRRYRDTRKVFPHLVNGGKYLCTVFYYMTLSMYRLDRTDHMLALFVTFAAINAVYVSIWDVVMDWSLFDPYAKNRFLRDQLAFKHPSVYYIAMVLDPILRFNWIFYAIFLNDTQHSAILAFLISFSEVCRRGVWTLFRVENEHCTNVKLYRASRDVPLPYKVPSEDDEDDGGDGDGDGDGEQSPRHSPAGTTQSPATAAAPSPPYVSGASLERQQTRDTAASSLRRRQTAPGAGAGAAPATPSIRSRVGIMLHSAHAQDFERRRAPADQHQHSDDDDDDDDDIANHGDDTDDDDHDGGGRSQARPDARDQRADRRDLSSAEELLRAAPNDGT